MKRIVIVVMILATIIAISSCDYDDSSDIDVLNPVDSTATGIVPTK